MSNRDYSEQDLSKNIVNCATGQHSRSDLAGGINGFLAAEGTTHGHIVVLCAEPDMGKTSVIKHVLSCIESRGGKAKLISLSGLRPDRAASRVVSACRQMSHYLDGERTVALGFDDIPSADENDIQRMVRALRKLELAGGNLLLSLNPEAEGLADELSDSRVYRADDLKLTGRMPALRAHMEVEPFMSVTHGIPRLVRALMLVPDGSKSDRTSDPRYVSALGDVVEHSLRSSLIWEERWARLAMILLGSGSLQDVRYVAGDVDQSLWLGIARDAPLFGIDTSRRTFDCAGVMESDNLRSLIPRLRPVTGRCPALSVRAVELLMGRNDYRRASVVALACGPRERTAMVLAHAAEFINVGARDMVEDAISYAAEMGVLDNVQEARIALAVFLEPKRTYERLRDSVRNELTNRVVRLLVQFRDCLCVNSGSCAGPSTPAAGEATAGMAHSLAEALSGVALMREFRFEEAYSYLMGVPERRIGPTIASCIIWAEYFLSMGLSGNAPTDDDLAGFDAATSFAKESGANLLYQVLSGLGSLVRSLAANDDRATVPESCAQAAALVDLPLVQEVFLLAAGVADLRADSCARAYVRFQRVSELSRLSGDKYLQGSAHILLCATKRLLGDEVSADEVLATRMPPRVAAVARALAAVIEDGDSARLEIMGRTRATACPEGTTWLVHVLASDFGDLSGRFKAVTPQPWLEEAHMMAIVGREFGDERKSGVDEPCEVGFGEQAYRVDLSLLGGFRVTVNGVPVAGMRLERRRAKSLLTLLAVLPDHTARRYEIMETVWPDLDYHDARQRVYEATSVLRCELTKRLGVKGSPLVSSRGAGTLGLDPSCVHCDIDDFEKLARSLISNSRLRPTDVVNGCARLEKMYEGDVYVPLVDGAGLVSERREELKSLYADVMVYASQQALALGRAETAAHFAQIACSALPLREDAELCLIKALGAAGRTLDAESSYHDFVERIAREARRPVSQTLRDAYHGIVAGSEELVLHLGGERDAEDQVASA